MHEQRVWRQFDFIGASIMLLLSGLSLFIIASATQSDGMHYVTRQLLWIALGVAVLFLVLAIPYERFRNLAPYLYGLMIVLLAVVLVAGKTALGAQRWIDIGPFQLQPSEFAKPGLILMLAAYLSTKEKLDRWRDLAIPFGIVAIPMLLIIKQPDLGTALVLVAITAGMFYLAGVPWLKMLIIFPGGLAFVVLWIYLHFRFHIPIPMHSYQLNRLTIFLHPQSDPLGNGFNVIQSRIAIGTGGLWGSGLLASPASQLSFLPESYTDFIFAVIGKELGFIGAMALLLVYFALIARVGYIAAHARDRFGTLLSAGVAAMFAFHVVESAGMASGVMPVAGVPLPFISYGGSAYLADAASLGLAINVWMRRQALPFVAVLKPKRELAAPYSGDRLSQ